jgi:hypothetical protein
MMTSINIHDDSCLSSRASIYIYVAIHALASMPSLPVAGLVIKEDKEDSPL